MESSAAPGLPGLPAPDSAVSPPASPFRTLRATGLLFQCLLGVIAMVVVWRIVAGPPAADRSASDPGGLAVFYLGIGLVMAARMRAAKIDVSRLLGPAPSRDDLSLVLAAMPLGLLSVAGFWILFLPLSYAAPDFVRVWAFERAAGHVPTSLTGWVAQLSVTVLLAPVLEELLFRGLLLQRWAYRWGTTTGVVLSSAVFAIGHIEIVGHFLFGLAMAALYLRTRRLLVPMVAHALNNLLASLFELPEAISPASADKMTVTSFQSQWWVGLLLLAVGLAFLEAYRRKFWADIDLRALFRGPVPYSAG